jgi:hypothetical protein
MVGIWYNLQQYLQQNVQQNYETRTPGIGPMEIGRWAPNDVEVEERLPILLQLHVDLARINKRSSKANLTNTR